MPQSSLISYIFLFGAIIVGFFFLRPSWQRFQTLRTENQELYEIKGEIESLLAESSGNIDTLRALSQEEVTRIREAVPRGDHLFEFLIMLQSFSIQHGVKLRRVEVARTAEGTAKTGAAPFSGSSPTLPQPKPGTLSVRMAPKDSLNELLVNLTLVAPYSSAKTFLRELERNLRITDVTTLSFTAPSRGNELLEMAATIKAYYQ